ncbi:MAG: D-Ala-D-Ala carboxypeptidase family metallohydrolase [Candidatus Cloacimonetes bacterium]|nr:D-Ala-D-Ala carboxypeptidase family metallohydrolase [Candidatus Cloacimonadota bacterium]
MSVFNMSIADIAMWSIRSTAAIEQFQGTKEQKDACKEVLSSLKGYAWALTLSTDDGDLVLTLQVDSTNHPKFDSTPYTVRSVSAFVRDTFIAAGLPGIKVDIDENSGRGTVVLVTNNVTTYDNTTPPDVVPTKAPVPVNVETAKKVDTPAVAVVPNDSQSADAKQSVNLSVPNTSEFYLDVQVFLEGVQVPHNTCAVSYGLNSPPSCTIIIPASSMIRDLPETTKIHVFFKDLLPTAAGIYEWRLLFDGELSSLEYTADSEGASMSISGMHSSAYMTLMQILSLDVASYVFDSNPHLIGNATLSMVLGQSKVNNTIIKNILNAKGYQTMADIVFQLLRSILNGTSDSAVGKFYSAKLGNVAQGWKILKRIYGISQLAANAQIATVKASTNKTADNESSANPSSGSTSDAQTNTAMDAILIRNYTLRDFAGSNFDSDKIPGMNAAFIELFGKLHDAAALASPGFSKFRITSGWRSAAYNSSLEGAASNSQHLYGRAADVDPAPLTQREVGDLARSLNFSYVDDTYAAGHVHIDLR